MSEFVLEDFVQELRAATLAEEPVKRVRELMAQTFQDPEAIRAAMPVYDSDDEILFEDDSIALKPEGIHSVEAADGVQSCGIHVYLAKLTTIERSLFDWASGEACPFNDENYDLMKRVAV